MIIRLDDCPLKAWKNGLGGTREIAVHPLHASMDDFTWRVSIANVDSAAPFSCFPGIDRQIVLLDGAGFTMLLNDGQSHALTTPCVPFAFPGEASVDVILADGPTRDFNVMVRRSDARGFIEVCMQPGNQQLDQDVVLIHCVRGKTRISQDTLLPGDSYVATATTPSKMTLGDETTVLVIHIQSRDADQPGDFRGPDYASASKHSDTSRNS